MRHLESSLSMLAPIERFQVLHNPRIHEQSDVICKRNKVKGISRAKYDSIITNPFAKENSKEFTNVFHPSLNFDKLRGFITTEPEATYDKQLMVKKSTLRTSLHTEQDLQRREVLKNELTQIFYDELDRSAEMSLQLTSFVNTHEQEIMANADRVALYKQLVQTVFGTTDVDNINIHFSQAQRRGFRLSIVNFIQDLDVIRTFSKELQQNPRGALRKIELPFVHPQEIIVKPTGVGLVLSQQEFSQIDKISESNTVGRVHNRFIMNINSSLGYNPLDYKIMLVKQDNHGQYDQEVVDHEFQHLTYHNFYQREKGVIIQDSWDEKRAQISAPQIFKNAKEHAKDEILAYMFTGEPNVIEPNTFTNNYLKKQIISAKKMSEGAYETYWKGYTDYLKEAALYQWIAAELVLKAQREKSTLTEEKVHALLFTTQFEKVKRLGVYIGIQPQDVQKKYIQRANTITANYIQTAHIVIEKTRGLPQKEQEKIWWEEAGGGIQFMSSIYTREAFSTVLDVIEQCVDPYLLETSLLTAQNMYSLYGHPLSHASPDKKLSQQDLSKLLLAVEQVKTHRTGERYTEVRDMADKLLLFVQNPKDPSHMM